MIVLKEPLLWLSGLFPTLKVYFKQLPDHLSSLNSTMLQIIIAVLGTLFLFQWYQTKKNANLPPGPKGLPIIGNLMDLPPKSVPEYQHWLSFKDTYGPISSITVLGTTLVLIHDKQAAHDLLEKAASETSSRPKVCTLEVNYVLLKDCSYTCLITAPFDNIVSWYTNSWAQRRQ